MSDIRIQDDLYEAVNGDWIKNATIPSDRPVAGGFAELDMNVEKMLMADFKDFANNSKVCEINEIKEATKLYKKYIDVESRDKDGINPVLPLLNKIDSLKDISDFNEKAIDFAYSGIYFPFDFGVTPDMKNAKVNSFVLTSQTLILPDTTYYAEGNEAGKQLLEVYKSAALELLSLTPLSKEEQEEYLKDTISFDQRLSKVVKSQVEWAEYTKCYNPYKLDDACELLKPFDLKGLLKKMYSKEVEKVIIYDVRALENFSNYFNNDTFNEWKHWCYVKTLLIKSRVLSCKAHTIAGTFNRVLMGVKEEPVIEKQAYQTVSGIYSDAIGVYYGRTYFGEEAKKDIVSIVKDIIACYKVRIKTNKFLSESTKEKACLKLDTMEIKMGYPDYILPYYETLKVDENDSLFDAYQKLMVLKHKNEFDKLFKAVDRKEWGMPGHMVNACYNPTTNDITFPAAILQKPFYALSQSKSENLGGIGAVIGHEISHAFDNNGAQFDEQGNLHNWWTKEDYAHFKDLTEDMIKEFDGIEFRGGKVNGKLVVSENIADNGGLAVALEIMHSLDKPDFEAFFKNWAKVWCQKSSDEYALYLLSCDVHAPARLRANIQVRNFDEWYTTFNVTEKDQMYISPEKRVHVW